MTASMGGTYLKGPLVSAVQTRNKQAEKNTQIIVLTDGEVFNTQETLDFVFEARQQERDSIRFFALGIGEQVSHELVEGIGRIGGGYAEVVGVDSRGKWQERVIQMLKSAHMPPSWNTSIQLPSIALVRGEGNGVVRAPKTMPPIHPFGRQSVFFTLDLRKTKMPTSVMIMGSSYTSKKWKLHRNGRIVPDLGHHNIVHHQAEQIQLFSKILISSLEKRTPSPSNIPILQSLVQFKPPYNPIINSIHINPSYNYGGQVVYRLNPNKTV